MSASAISTPNVPNPLAAAGGQPVAGAALAGFEALLATLFGPTGGETISPANAAVMPADPAMVAVAAPGVTTQSDPAEEPLALNADDGGPVSPDAVPLADPALMMAMLAPVTSPGANTATASSSEDTVSQATTPALPPAGSSLLVAQVPQPVVRQEAAMAATPAGPDLGQQPAPVPGAAGAEARAAQATPPPIAPAPTTLASPTSSAPPQQVAAAAVAAPPPAAHQPAPADRGEGRGEKAARVGARPSHQADTGPPMTADATRGDSVTSANKPPAASEREPMAAEPKIEAAEGSKSTPDARMAAAGQEAELPVTHTAALRGAPETVANLAAQMIKKLEGRSTRFDIELDPHGLGRVDVRVEIGAHGRITAAMTADNPQAAAELRSRSAELSRALEQAGFDVAGGLSFDVAGDRGQSGGRAHDQQGDAGAAFRGRAFQAALDTADQADLPAGGSLNLRRTASGVDIRI